MLQKHENQIIPNISIKQSNSDKIINTMNKTVNFAKPLEICKLVEIVRHIFIRSACPSTNLIVTAPLALNIRMV